ncbi:MAG TPA: GreA/GreB family elongation factor [Rectinemataceae bacterium]|nr:GreA/GreB family elongation factor [Rectinemataceae bacterium]
MSRAFVDEDASAANESEAPEIKLPIPPGSRNYLTSEGAEALSRELHELSGVERPRVVAEISSHALSGESPDKDGVGKLRRRLGEVDRRIAYLYAMSSLAEMVEPPPPEGRDRVKFGAWVRVRNEAGVEAELRIVGIDEADPSRGWIGWASPVARSLVGRKIGDEARVKLPSGESRLIVLGIDYR